LDDRDALADQLSGVAQLGRMCVAPAGVYLAGLLAQCRGQMQAALTAGADAFAMRALYERAMWLVRRRGSSTGPVA
jgi:hypothetical protein